MIRRTVVALLALVAMFHARTLAADPPPESKRKIGSQNSGEPFGVVQNPWSTMRVQALEKLIPLLLGARC